MSNVSDDVIELTKRFISIPGYVELPEKETKVAEALYKELCDRGMQARLINHNGRYNVICEYDSGIPGPIIVLCTHLDTVPPYEMENAFCGKILAGRLYGRGAVDVKGILAAMTLVMEKLFQEKPDIFGKVKFLAVSDEESGSYGIRQEFESGFDADVVIVGEPTEFQLGVAHKGVAWIQTEFHGKAAHGSVPEKGHNAIYDANDFINLIKKRLIPELKQNKTHPLLGAATINVGRIDGGTRPTIVPEKCIVQIDRRMVPGETVQDTVDEIRDIIKEAGYATKNVHTRIILGDARHPFPPLDSSSKKNIIDCIRSAVAETTGKETECVGLPFWTDAALAEYYTGKPAFVIGPGNIARAHSNNEYVELEQLEQSVHVYYSIVKAIGGFRKG